LYILYIRDLSTADTEVASQIARGVQMIVADDVGCRQLARAAEIIRTVTAAAAKLAEQGLGETSSCEVGIIYLIL
jgi:hypothetical protein